MKSTGSLNHQRGKYCLAAIVACLLFAIGVRPVNAQTRGRLEIIKDSRVDSLIAHRYSATSKAGTKSGSISAYGYRVQIFTGSSRKDAFNAQNRFLQLHPEMRTYITYREPNFKVRAGDFRTRLEAVKLMQELKGMFTSLFIISEKINLPKLDTNTDQP